MQKICMTLRRDLKEIDDYNHNNKKNYGKANLFLREQILIVVSVGLLNLRTALMKCLEFISFSIWWFCYDFLDFPSISLIFL